MRRQKKKQNGTGAICSALKRFLHPRKDVAGRYPNAVANERLPGLLAIRREEKSVNRAMKLCIVFRHDDFPNIEIYCAERYAAVVTEGSAADYFDQIEGDTVDGEGGEDNDLQELPTIRNSDIADSIARLRSEGYGVDDDNDPAPENLPNEAVTSEPSMYGEWNSTPNICHRTTAGLFKDDPKMKVEVMTNGNVPSYMDWFMVCLPAPYIKNVILFQTNASEEGEEITEGEFLVYIGLWLLMATTASGCDRRSYWENSPINEWKGAPFRLNKYMSWGRFDFITQHLTFTDIDPPSYADRFHEVRQMIDAFNEHMEIVFSPSWISCLDESISIWTSKWTCPGWMYVPRKPHPMGNEYHSICCGICGVMFAIELVEGKDHPKQRPAPKYNEEGKTASLLLRLCSGIFNTGKVVILDSGFCVLKAIIALKKKGVYASALIKKRRYWPRYIKGDAIKAHFEDEVVGVSKRLPGVLDGEKFDIFCLKEPDYVMSLMSTYGSLNTREEQRMSVREVNEEKIEFRYT